MPWDDIIGHERAVRGLQRQIVRGTVHHAYLFVGPSGVGRRTVALRFAQALACLQPPAPGQACGVCRVCRQFAASTHPDFHLVAPERGTLKVEAVRQQQAQWNLSPKEARYRVALLPQVEQATPAAANALLKTLEEPPAHLVLLLTAPSPEALLPTVVSRCEVVRLRPVPGPALQAALAARGVPADRAATAAAWSGGRPGLALRLARDPEVYEAYTQAWARVWNLLRQPLYQRLRFAEDFAPERRDEARVVVERWLEVWRAVLHTQWQGRSPYGPPGWQPALAALAQRVTRRRVRALLGDLLEAQAALARFANPRLVLGALLTAWPHLPDLPLPPAGDTH